MLSLDRNGDSPKQDACFPRLLKGKPKALLPIREVLHK